MLCYGSVRRIFFLQCFVLRLRGLLRGTICPMQSVTDEYCHREECWNTVKSDIIHESFNQSSPVQRPYYYTVEFETNENNSLNKIVRLFFVFRSFLRHGSCVQVVRCRVIGLVL